MLTTHSYRSTIDWVFFIILDINNPAIDAIPAGVRVLAGLMQGIAVRAAGFAIIPLAAIAPGVKYGSRTSTIFSSC